MSQIPPQQPPSQFAGYPRQGQWQRPPSIRFDAIGDAWQLVTKALGPYMGSTFVFFIIQMAVVAVPYFLFIIPFILSMNASRGRSPDPSILLAILPAYAFIAIASWIMIYLGHAMLSHLALRQLRGEEASVGDMFNFEGMFWQHCLAGVITAFGTIVGTMLCYIPGLLFMGLMMFVPFLISDRKMTAVQAIQASYETLKGDMWMALLFVFVINIVASLGTFACCIGYLVSYPMYPLSVGVLYRDYFMQNDMRMSNPMGGVTDFTQPPR